MRRVERAIVGSVLLLSVLLMAPVAGWAKVFTYTETRSFSLPKQIQFADEAGNAIERMVMKGTQVRTIYVDVRDFNGDGVWDARDYITYSVPLEVSLDIVVSGDNAANIVTVDDLLELSPDLQPRFQRALDALFVDYNYLGVSSATQDLLDIEEDVRNALRLNYYPRRLSLLRVHARQQSGNQGSSFNEENGELKYTLYFGSAAQRAQQRTNPTGATGMMSAATPRMSVLIRPSDPGGGNGDNGGGSCDALALGAAALLAPGLFLLRKKR